MMAKVIFLNVFSEKDPHLNTVEHSDHEPNYLKMRSTFHAQGFYPDKLMVRYTDQGAQL